MFNRFHGGVSSQKIIVGGDRGSVGRCQDRRLAPVSATLVELACMHVSLAQMHVASRYTKACMQTRLCTGHFTYLSMDFIRNVNGLSRARAMLSINIALRRILHFRFDGEVQLRMQRACVPQRADRLMHSVILIARSKKCRVILKTKRLEFQF